MTILTKAISILKKDIKENGEPIDSDYNIGISHAICVLEALKENEPLQNPQQMKGE